MSKRLFLAALFTIAFLSGKEPQPACAVLTATHSTAYVVAHSHAATSLAKAIAEQARRQAMAMCSVGLCYRGVKHALSSLGIDLEGNAAWMAKDQLSQDSRFVMVPLKSLRPGDILVHGRSKAHPYGHIAVYLGNNQEASDHVQKLVLGGRYGSTVVFRARSANECHHRQGQTMVALSTVTQKRSRQR